MENAGKEVAGKIKEIDKKIASKYGFLDDTSSSLIKSIKKSNNLTLRHMRKLSEYEAQNVSKNKGIIGVDGSINTIGSSYPHYISVMQSLAKCTDRNYKDVILADVHTPILDEKESLFVDTNIPQQDKDEKLRAAKMAKLELEAAVKAIEEMDASIIIMDGSLIRYKISCGGLWDDFVEKVIQKNVYVIGVIEEIKTKELSKFLDIFSDQDENIYDREVLFGTLEQGQMLVINETEEMEGFKKSFMRTSKDPHVIGMDILEQHANKINELSDFVYTLTAEGGRGIPLWLDIVDNEVKISDKFVDSLIDSYIRPDIRKRFFTAKRENRNL